MQLIKGTLIPIGGNEDKGIKDDENYSLEFIDEGILSHVVREAGGIDANIVVIPTASSIPAEVGENYIKAFSKLGCKNVGIAQDSWKISTGVNVRNAKMQNSRLNRSVTP